jgi:hypothetical protein
MDGLEAVRRSEGGHARGRCRILALAVFSGLVPVAVSLFLALNTTHAQTSLLANGGFEEGTAGWSQSYGSTFVTVTTPVSAGNWAASLTKSGVLGEIWIYQDVDVYAGATYTLTGWVYKNDSAFQDVCLRIEWHGTGGVDQVQDCLSQDAGYYRPITVGPTLAPPDTSKARIKLLADIRTANPPSPVYFDDIRLTSNLMPRGYLPLGLKNYPS